MSDEAPTLDLSAFDFGPAWAKESASGNPAPREFREYREPREPRGDQRGNRPPFKNRKPGGGPRRPDRDRDRKPDDRRKHGGPKGGGPRRDLPPPPPPNPFPWLRFAFQVTEPAVETVAKQIRHTGKTFSLFDLARILLRNPASYNIELTSAPVQPAGPFYVVRADGSVWMSLENATRHILHGHLADYYRAEVVEVEPPKGNFPVVAVCGMSGVLLGPPNHHDFERRVRELHREKFPRLSFEEYRSRLKMERDPERIEQWKQEASKVTRYFPVNVENAEALADLSAVEKHFLEHQAPALVDHVQRASVPGNPKAARVDSSLAPLLNHVSAEESRFPLRLAQSLSRTLSAAGLRFHKGANRTTFVSASRPQHLNLEEVTVSDSIRKILETIRAKKSIRRAQLLDLLAPAPEVSAAPVIVEAAPVSEINEAAEATDPSPAPETPAAPAVDPARESVINDLLWLTHEGYVVEYADGRLESVPPPKNPKPQQATAVEAAATVETPATETPVEAPIAETAPSEQSSEPSDSSPAS
jgi:hypothetical protein